MQGSSSSNATPALPRAEVFQDHIGRPFGSLTDQEKAAYSEVQLVDLKVTSPVFPADVVVFTLTCGSYRYFGKCGESHDCIEVLVPPSFGDAWYRQNGKAIVVVGTNTSAKSREENEKIRKQAEIWRNDLNALVLAGVTEHTPIGMTCDELSRHMNLVGAPGRLRCNRPVFPGKHFPRTASFHKPDHGRPLSRQSLSRLRAPPYVVFQCDVCVQQYPASVLSCRRVFQLKGDWVGRLSNEATKANARCAREGKTQNDLRQEALNDFYRRRTAETQASSHAASSSASASAPAPARARALASPLRPRPCRSTRTRNPSPRRSRSGSSRETSAA